MIIKNITDFGIIGYECRSAENLIDGGDGVTIPPVVARIFFGRQHLTFDKGGKDMVRGKGLLSFCNGCGNGSIGCNGRSEQGKDALSVCAQGLCKDAKPTKHTQTLTLQKARGIVWM